MKLFTYGSIVVPDIIQNVLGFVPQIEKSVFIRGWRILLQNAESKKYAKYHYLMADFTGDDDNIVSGFLVDIPEESIEKLDKWEGAEYSRIDVICYTRELKEIECQIYVKTV